MPRRSQPRYDASRNQWYLNYRRKKYFLCSGKGNYVEAMQRAAAIMADFPPVNESMAHAGCVCNCRVPNPDDFLEEAVILGIWPSELRPSREHEVTLPATGGAHWNWDIARAHADGP